MNPAVRCVCRAVVRASRKAPLTSQSVAVRQMHAFRPSVVLYKRKKATHESDAATTTSNQDDEFEEDSFDDTVTDEQYDLGNNASYADGSSRDALGVSLLSRQERFARYYAVLDAALDKQHADFKSNIPSLSLLDNLVKTTGTNDVDRLLDIVARWRRKGLPVRQSTSDLLLRKLSKMGEERLPQLIEVLSNGTKFGLQSIDARALDKAFIQLTAGQPAEQDRASTTEAEDQSPAQESDAGLQARVESANQLVQLERFYLDSTSAPRDPFGPLLALAPTLTLTNSSSTSQLESNVKTLLDDVKSHGANGLAKFISTLTPSSRQIVRQRLETIVEELIKANSADARWFKQVISVLEA
ncbi:hypothetical protein ACM66B_002369 [Microbotryomycetes sp. NB124-2]